MPGVAFLPGPVTIEADSGECLMDVARRPGVFIRADCGGQPQGGTCRVLVEPGAMMAGGAVTAVAGRKGPALRSAGWDHLPPVLPDPGLRRGHGHHPAGKPGRLS